MMRRALSIAWAVILASCATVSTPIVDSRGVDPARYQRDYAECVEVADHNAKKQATVGAIAGAIFGAVTSAIFCVGRCIATVAATAAATIGTASGVHEQQTALKRCLADRGYTVIGTTP